MGKLFINSNIKEQKWIISGLKKKRLFLDIWKILLCSYLTLQCVWFIFWKNGPHKSSWIRYVTTDFSGLSDLHFFPGDFRYTVPPLLSQALFLSGTDTPKETLPRPVKSGSWRYLQAFSGILVSFCCIPNHPKAQRLKITPSYSAHNSLGQQSGLSGQFIYGPIHAFVVSCWKCSQWAGLLGSGWSDPKGFTCM